MTAQGESEGVCSVSVVLALQPADAGRLVVYARTVGAVARARDYQEGRPCG